MSAGKKVSESRVTMTEMVLPSHTNALGTIFGGTIMSWIDIAAAIAASRHSQRTVVTVHMDDMQFIAPVKTGWIVNLYASVNYVGSTSMEVGVRVEAENARSGNRHHTATAYLTFVALDEDGKPCSVIPLIPETELDKKRNEAAKKRRENRLKFKGAKV